MPEDRSTVQPAAAAPFSAADLKRRMAEREAEKAAEEVHKKQEQEEKQKALIAEFHKPPQRTPEQLMQMVMQLVGHAADLGQSEVQVYRFPSGLCSDGGRRINNSLPNWDTSLEGRAKFAYDFWHEQLRPLGFHLKAEVLDYPGGRLGDIGFFLSWK